MEHKRVVFSKNTRVLVLSKYKNHCAYCGCDLDLKSLQVDHLHPFFLAHFQKDLDPNRLDNLMPACAKCNRFKHSFRLEDYRHELSMQVKRLKKNAQFMRAVTFGQVEIKERPIEFYFEHTTPKTKER